MRIRVVCKPECDPPFIFVAEADGEQDLVTMREVAGRLLGADSEKWQLQLNGATYGGGRNPGSFSFSVRRRAQVAKRPPPVFARTRWWWSRKRGGQ